MEEVYLHSTLGQPWGTRAHQPRLSTRNNTSVDGSNRRHAMELAGDDSQASQSIGIFVNRPLLDTRLSIGA